MTAYGTGVCAVSSCARQIPEGRLMCPRHWRMVPERLQREVNFAWSRWRNNEATLGDLRAVQDEAVASVG